MSAGNQFCTGCGARVPDRPDTTSTIPRDTGSPARHVGRPPRKSSRTITLATVAVVLAGIGAGGWLLASHLGKHGGSPLRLASDAAEHTVPRSSPASPTAPVTPTTPAPVSSQALSQTVGTVTLADSVMQDTDASSVATFLNQYFQAIDNHDYQSYLALLTPQVQQGITSLQFDQGYATTADSAETLTGISAAANGDTQADATFTSHQNPADSPDGTQSCTNWSISLFLQSDGNGGYLIDQAPSGYHASYQAC